MSSKKLSPGLLIGILLFVFFGTALVIRTVLPWDQVFGGHLIRYTSVDGYYYMRLVDNMVHNFPHYTAFDPFNVFPKGWEIGHLGFFYQVLSGVIWVVGLGHPSQHLVDVIGALYPPVMAALTVVPVYFIGKTLFNRWAGVIAAALFAVLPGEYLGRSILGFTDTPVIETFFTSCAIALLMVAIKTARERRLSIDHVLKLDRGIFLRPVVYSLLAGLFLGCYMITWAGGLLFVFIITFYLVVQFIIDHLAGRSTEYLGIVGFVLFLVNGLIYLPKSEAAYLSAAVVIAILVPPVMVGVARYLNGRHIKPAYYPAAIFGLAVVLVGILFAISSGTAQMMFAAFRIFAPVGSTATTTMEMQPFLSPQGSFSTAVAWGNFTTSFFLIPGVAIPGFALIAYLVLAWLVTGQPAGSPQRKGLRATVVSTLALSILFFIIHFSVVSSLAVLIIGLIMFILSLAIFIWLLSRQGDAGTRIFALFFLWTLIMLVLTLAQRRYAYYFVVNVALLSAWLSWQAVWFFSLRRLERKPEPAAADAKSKRSRRRHKSTGLATYRVITGAVAAAVFLVVFLPNIVKSDQVARTPQFSPSNAWLDSLIWIKDNTPEPLGSPEAYYGLYKSNYVYPDSAYAVTSWWDYGYWITRIAHRIPSDNPSQQPDAIMAVARLFLSRNNATAENMTNALRTKYVAIDYATATSKFWAIATWANESMEEYMPSYYVQQGNSILPAQAFSPEYYQTLVVRLYNFGGQEVTQVKPTVVTFTTKVDSSGFRYRLVTATQQFDSYQAALDYVQQQGPATHAIIGTNAFVSPIPLAAVPGFSLVHESEQSVNTQGAGSIPEVRVFARTGQ